MFMGSTGDSHPIDIDMSGAVASIGSESQEEMLVASDPSGGSFTGGHGGIFEGSVTYNFTSAVPPVPEPSTWAMLLIGFGSLGYVGARRKRDFRAISA